MSYCHTCFYSGARINIACLSEIVWDHLFNYYQHSGSIVLLCNLLYDILYRRQLPVFSFCERTPDIFFLSGRTELWIHRYSHYLCQFTNKATDAIGLLTLSAASILSGLFSVGITLFSQYLFSRFIGLATSLQLMEIIRPDSPLLQYILSTAPGTYQHSLMVANLSEQAAKEIGADPLLVRAGAMYHDAGKALNPSFFVENQVSGNLNLHDDISPKESAASIIQHVRMVSI